MTSKAQSRRGTTPMTQPRRGTTREAQPRRAATPEALITLANLGLPRRPAGARTRVTEAALPDAATASRQLGALIAGPVTEADLPSLRSLQRAAAQAVGALLAGEVPDCVAINAVASGSTGRAELVVSGGELRERIVWDDGTAAAAGASATWPSTTPPAPAPVAGTRRIRADGGSASTPVATPR